MTGIAHGRRHWLHLYHRRRWLHRWHRTIGALVAGFLVYLIATGLPLQFSDELSLGSRHVDQEWILDWYGIQAPTRVLESGGITSVANIVFRDQQAIGVLEGFRGAISFDGLSLVAGESEILLHDPQANEQKTHLFFLCCRTHKVRHLAGLLHDERQYDAASQK